MDVELVLDESIAPGIEDVAGPVASNENRKMGKKGCELTSKACSKVFKRFFYTSLHARGDNLCCSSIEPQQPTAEHARGRVGRQEHDQKRRNHTFCRGRGLRVLMM